VPAVRDYAATLPHVVYAGDNKYSCSDVGLSNIKQAIKEHKLNRVVVAACTPRTHEPLFRRTVAEAGVNPFLFHFVNIREQCSWVHRDQPDAATEKAKALITMGVARAALLEPLEALQVPVGSTALVIGGGLAGLAAARSFAARNFKVLLVEKSDHLGGLVAELHSLYPSGDTPEHLVKDYLEAVEQSDSIEILLETQLVDVSGFIGNYQVLVENAAGERRTLETSVIVVATGAEPLKPEGYFAYDGARVISQWELEHKFADADFQPPSNVVMIQCAGARVPERPYCGKICCVTALKNALDLQQRGSQVYILHRDMQAWGVAYEDWYRRARQAGVRFLRYVPERPPQVEEKTVRVWDEYDQLEEELPADLVVLSTPLVAPSAAEQLSKLLKVPQDEHGFFLEAHVKLRPVDFSTDGIFLAGSARWPCDIPEALATGLAAASRASITLSQDEITVEPIVSVVDEEKCIGCGLCERTCPYAAISLENLGEKRVARVVTASCKGCGACAAGCPVHAITMQHFTDEQLLAEIQALK